MRRVSQTYIIVLLAGSVLLVPVAYGAEKVAPMGQLHSAARVIPASRTVTFRKPTPAKKTEHHTTTRPATTANTRPPSTDTKTTTNYKTRSDSSELARSPASDYLKKDVTRAAKAGFDNKSYYTASKRSVFVADAAPKDDREDVLPSSDQQKKGSRRSESAPKSSPKSALVGKSTPGHAAFAPLSRQVLTLVSEKTSVTLKTRDAVRLAAVDTTATEIALPSTVKQPDIDKPVPHPQQPQAKLCRKTKSQSLPKTDTLSEIVKNTDAYLEYVLAVEVVRQPKAEEIRGPEVGVAVVPAQEKQDSSKEQVGKKNAQKGISASDILTRDKDNSRLVRRAQTVSASELAFGNLRLLPPLDVFIPQNMPEKADNASGRTVSQTSQNGQGSFNAVIDTDKTFKDQRAARAINAAGKVLNDQWKLPASCGPPRITCPQSFDTVPAAPSAQQIHTGAAEKPRTFQNPQESQEKNNQNNKIEPPPLSLSLPWLVSKANVIAAARINIKLDNDQFGPLSSSLSLPWLVTKANVVAVAH